MKGANMKKALIIVVALIVVIGASYTIVKRGEQKNQALEIEARKAESARKKAEAAQKKSEAEARKAKEEAVICLSRSPLKAILTSSLFLPAIFMASRAASFKKALSASSQLSLPKQGSSTIRSIRLPRGPSPSFLPAVQA